jgi:signal transduction histidine kinase
MSYILKDSIKKEILMSVNTTLTYLDSYGQADSTVFIRSNLQPFVNLQIYDSSGRLILDNHSSYVVKPVTDRYIDDYISSNKQEPLPDTVQGSVLTIYTYYTEWKDAQGKSYYLRFSRRPVHENDFILLLRKQLAASVLICLGLTILSGMFLMRKSLEPLSTICNTLQHIEVNKLEKRIDLTEQKSELYDLAVTINQTLDRIEYGYKQQQQFISDASHELRTPITVISGYVNLLDRWGKNDQATLEEGISAIKSETDYMGQLIERLLFLARANRGTLVSHFKKIDSAELLREIYDGTMLIAGKHTVILKENQSAFIYAEAGSVKQMLRIFIDNALKYTPEGGFIYLSCRCENDKVYYSIRDTGIGIPKEDLERVFERFYRVDSSRTKETGGSGLGLAIAKYIAGENKAELHLESTFKQGTTVTAVFPVYHGEAT